MKPQASWPLDLLGAVPPYVFFVPAEVLQEITYPDQQVELKEALDRGWIRETRLEAIHELQIFTRANEQLGSGESACIALAEARNWALARVYQPQGADAAPSRSGRGVSKIQVV